MQHNKRTKTWTVKLPGVDYTIEVQAHSESSAIKEAKRQLGKQNK